MPFKNVDYDALHFHTGSLKINIFRGGHKKEYSVYAFDNVDNCGLPLRKLRKTHGEVVKVAVILVMLYVEVLEG